MDSELVSRLEDLSTSITSHNSQSINPTDVNQELERELQQVRAVNQSISSVVDSISISELNLEKVVKSTLNVDELLNRYISILSQTNHTKRLILDESWRGSTVDDAAHRARLQELQQSAEELRKLKEAKLLQAEAAEKKRLELVEAKRKRDEILQKRIYGNKPVRKK
ncbi:DASH complex subunit Duo1-domain-containing protein [Lipomyces oligophaga]|uniref:DASH complex subunit Duo1-domain-containing protein n=1 Tax=Lipomyces oligophaga TaxID=45792 RepID=UPI0034CDE148